MDKNDEKRINLSPKELTYLFYALIGARDHDWQSGHNKCRRPWDLAKDYCERECPLMARKINGR